MDRVVQKVEILEFVSMAAVFAHVIFHLHSMTVEMILKASVYQVILPVIREPLLRRLQVAVPARNAFRGPQHVICRLIHLQFVQPRVLMDVF